MQKFRIQERLRKQHREKKVPCICLAMIVKNEAKNMPRLLASLGGIIDTMSIVDTGSTDDTIAVITAWGHEHGILTTIHQLPFRNFAYNRTHSVQMAKKSYPQADYFLLSDADFVWESAEGQALNKKSLTANKYLVEQRSTSLSYWNIRLLAARLDWVCLGVTHEYWQESKSQSCYMGEYNSEKLHSLYIDDREDGGCKGDKFVRDERLLRAALAHPATSADLRVRYHFYLGQTLKDLDRFVESTAYYEERTKGGGWPEELYYAKFKVGANHNALAWKRRHSLLLSGWRTKTESELEHLEKWTSEQDTPELLAKQVQEHFFQAAVSYLAAYLFRPSRAESLRAAATMFRQLRLWKTAFFFIDLGKQVPYPKNDSLFIESATYTYLFDFELALCACEDRSRYADGLAAYLRVKECKGLTEYAQAVIKKMEATYEKK